MTDMESDPQGAMSAWAAMRPGGRSGMWGGECCEGAKREISKFFLRGENLASICKMDPTDQN